MTDRGLLIWWTSQHDHERVQELCLGGLLDSWPEYIRDQFASRAGRAGRGRLWFGGLPDVPPPQAMWDDKNPLCKIASNAGGIVISAADLGHVVDLPGFVTTLSMTRPLLLQPTDELEELGRATGAHPFT